MLEGDIDTPAGELDDACALFREMRRGPAHFHPSATLWTHVVHLAVMSPFYRQGFMKTLPRPHDADMPSVPASAEVAAFLATLRDEQARFLTTIRQAASLLRADSGQLALVAATQCRLTQQVFDAQRAILHRRADVDAEVARIARSTDEQALIAVGDADDGVLVAISHSPPTRTARRRHRPMAVRRDTIAVADGPRRSPRQEVAALGVALVRTKADVDSLERVIDEAFEPGEPDTAAMQRQLAAVLDEWWRVEQMEGHAAIEDARARATVRRHIAGIAADDSFGVAPQPLDETAGTTRPTAEISPHLLPGHIADALDAADPADLQSVFAGLAEALDRPPADEPADDAADDAVRVGDADSDTISSPAFVVDADSDVLIRLDGPIALRPVAALEPEEAFRRFWSAGQAPSARRARLWWTPTKVLLQMTGATFVIVALLAWIG